MQCNNYPYKRVTVYHGGLFKGNATNNALIIDNGTVYSSNYCHDTVEMWCNSMIEEVGPPLYLLTDTYYGENEITSKIRNCQDTMGKVSGNW